MASGGLDAVFGPRFNLDLRLFKVVGKNQQIFMVMNPMVKFHNTSLPNTL